MKNFFEHQDVARKNTFRLVVLFSLAVLLTMVGVYLVAVLAVDTEAAYSASENGTRYADHGWWNLKAFAIASVSTLLLVGGGTLYKIRQLARGGGSLVCEQLGGRFVDFRTDDFNEQQLINVVEEMSIASGVSVPLLYVLDDEPGINAFAAGFTPNNAAVAVSRGCLEMLTRDELQGVIAHEFSHILNGDMRMNIRMIGILHGILMLALTGRVLMRFAFAGSRGRSRSSRDSGGAGLYLAVVGVALFVIGYVGRFFGQVIKSAISRQREYLADASAVQFTRNPKGLSGALQKIGGYSSHSFIDSPNADEVSHLFFSDALGKESWLNSMFATHPPLKKRIRRIDPSFHGAFPKVERPKRQVTAEPEASGQAEGQGDEKRWNIPVPGMSGQASSGAAAGAAGLAAGLAADGGAAQRASAPHRADQGADRGGQTPSDQAPAIPRRGGGRGGQRIKLDANQVMGSMGQTSQEHVDYARGALEAIPQPIRQAARDTYSAAGVVFALLIDVDPSTRQKQIAMLADQLTEALAEETRRYVHLMADLDPTYRLPLVEILVPALRQMSAGQHAKFVDILDRLIQADHQVDLFEFSLEKLLKHRLKASHGEGGRRVAQFYAVTALRDEIALLLSCLAYAGHDDIGSAEVAFRQALKCLKSSSARQRVTMLGKGECSLAELDGALDRLALATNVIKEQVVNATAHCVLADEEVTIEEAELLRAVCEVMDVPLPPFLPGVGQDA